jgi:hypothetical protein
MKSVLAGFGAGVSRPPNRASPAPASPAPAPAPAAGASAFSGLVNNISNSKEKGREGQIILRLKFLRVTYRDNTPTSYKKRSNLKILYEKKIQFN